MLHNELLREKVYESVASVLPITIIVLLLTITIAPLTPGTMMLFLFGAVLLIVGMGFFTLGVDMSMIPMGEGIGVQLSKAKKIILPLIMSFVQLSAIFALMSGLKIYDTVVALTNGGPAKATVVMPLWILQNSFSFNKFGYGSAMSMIFVLIVLIGMIIVKRIVRSDKYEQ